jgi:hypothetical protein
VPFLDIAFDWAQAAAGVDDGFTRDGLQKRVLAGLPSLLHAAAGLSPVEFHLALPRRLDGADVELPRFHRATSIHLHALNLRLTLPPSTGGFPKLETLSLSGYCVDLAALVRHCPCLRVLRVTQASLGADINIRSESLQKLFLWTNETRRWIDSINVEAPKLKRLTLLFGTDTGARLSVSIMTPLLEKASWWCLYATKSTGLAPWGLSMVRLYPAESLGAEEDTWSSQLSNVNVLSLEMKARVYLMSCSTGLINFTTTRYIELQHADIYVIIFILAGPVPCTAQLSAADRETSRCRLLCFGPHNGVL